MTSPTVDSGEGRLYVLDGWRGISILCVLAAHLLPLGPKALKLNGPVGVVGMSIFFVLSGFLITRFLIKHTDITDFLIRRFFRIIPLAWLAILLAFPFVGADADVWLANLFFYANLPPDHLAGITSHFWSLNVEVQFYLSIALLVGLFGRRGLYVLPLACLAITACRAYAGVHVSVVTWFRVDEILAGAILAMAYGGLLGQRPMRWVAALNPYVLLLLLLVCSDPGNGFINFFRPYIAALLVGATIMSPRPHLDRLLKSRVLGYIATISYALYVIHHLLVFTWLGSGDKLVKYLKRPLLLAVTFALAHASTFYYEQPCIALGKKLSQSIRQRRLAARGA